MSLDVAHGRFAVSTAAAGNTQTISGLGFQPSFIIFYWYGGTSASDYHAGTDKIVGIGFADASGGVVATGHYDNDNSQSVSGYLRTDSCIVFTDGYFSIDSMDSDGFTLYIENQVGSAYQVEYLAVYGSAVESCVDTFALASATQNDGYTGIGFEPNCILVAGGETGTYLSIGAATADTQAVTCIMHLFNPSDHSQKGVYGYEGEVAATMAGNSSNPYTTYQRGQLYSFDSDGYTIHTINDGYAGDGDTFIVLALNVPGVFLDIFTLATNTTPFSNSGYGFQPDAAFHSSMNAGPSSQDSPAVGNHGMTWGAATGPSNRSAVGLYVAGGKSNLQNCIWLETDEVGAVYNDSATLQYLMDLDSFDSDGQTLVMDNAASGAYWAWSLAFGTTSTQYDQSVAGTLSFAGAISRDTSFNVAGTMGLAGAVNKAVTKIAFEGGLALAGALEALRVFFKSVAGGLGFVGTLSKQTDKNTAGTLTLDGILSRATMVNVAGSLALVGAISKMSGKAIAGTLGLAGAISRAISVNVAGGLTLTGTLKRFKAGTEYVINWFMRMVTGPESNAYYEDASGDMTLDPDPSGDSFIETAPEAHMRYDDEDDKTTYVA